MTITNVNEIEEISWNTIREKYKISEDVYTSVSSLIKHAALRGQSSVKLKLSDYFNAPNSHDDYNKGRIQFLYNELTCAGYFPQLQSNDILEINWNPYNKMGDYNPNV